MIELPRTGTKREENNKLKIKKKPGSVQSKEKTFSSQLENSISFEFRGTLDELLADLDEQEKRFLDQQSLQELARYKALIRKILKALLEEGVETKTMKKTRRNFAELTVREIDEKLLELSAAITRNNRAFNLLKAIEEIRGLVLDLVH
jgi:uncharacterized protein YaaR (DUF327 family)